MWDILLLSMDLTLAIAMGTIATYMHMQYNRKIWRQIKLGGLAVYTTTTKLKSAKISYSHIYTYGDPVPNRQI